MFALLSAPLSHSLTPLFLSLSHARSLFFGVKRVENIVRIVYGSFNLLVAKDLARISHHPEGPMGFEAMPLRFSVFLSGASMRN